MRYAGGRTATRGAQRHGHLSRADGNPETRLLAIERSRRSSRLLLDAE
jgi:hypothetical protein